MSEATEPVNYYPIEPQNIAYLVKQPAFMLNKSLVSHGYISYQPGSRVGIGAFKTAHLGQLNIDPKPLTGPGHLRNDTIVFKRPYFQGRKTTEGNIRISRYTVADEIEKIIVEGNIFLWATSLMSMAYSFINRALEKASQQPPFDIPQFRFVRAGIVTAQQAITKQSTTTRAAYLIEEYIDPVLEGEYIKYVHNGDPVPLPEKGDDEFELAEFLCFIQHIQYFKTGSSVFVSDFQGM